MVYPVQKKKLENGYTRLVDFWALGVLIFEVSIFNPSHA